MNTFFYGYQGAKELKKMSESKRVVHLTTVHHPFDTRIYHKECVSLKQAGYHVSLIVAMEQEALNNYAKKTSDGITIIATRKRSNRIERMLLSTLETYRKAKVLEADYYHFHDPELLLVGWLLKRRGHKVIYDVHEDYYTSIMQKEYLWKPIRKMVANSYRKTEKFLSKNMGVCLAEKYYQEKFPEGICVLNYPKLNKKLINSQQYKEQPEDALLYTGNVSDVRGSFLHAAIPNFDENVHVHFVGKCQAKLAKQMKDVAGKSSERLIFEGIDKFVEREEIDNNYISRTWLAGLALFPPTEHYMRKELTKFFEYMSAGIPIICSNFPVWEAFIEKYQCGITVDPTSKDQIVQAINFLRDHPLERIRMAENGRKAVKSELNWQLEEDKLIRWYEEL